MVDVGLIAGASKGSPVGRDSAELKGPRQLLRIRPGIFDFEPELGLKLRQIKHNIPCTVPTNRHATIPNESGQILACFNDDPTNF